MDPAWARKDHRARGAQTAGDGHGGREATSHHLTGVGIRGLIGQDN